MAKIGRTLSYINTSPKPERNNGQTEQNQANGSSRPGNGGSSSFPGNLQEYLLKSIWDRVWEIKTDSQGNEYIFGKLPVVTQYGITMYADGGELNLPSIYAGLPIDNSTLIRDDNGVLKINPDIDLGGGASTWDELIGKPTWIGSTKPSYNYSEILQTPDLSVYALASDLAKYVTLAGDETITGLKNFAKGLQIDGLGITKSQDDVIYLDANLVVRGGITMFGTNSVDVPTIMDAIATDGVNLKVVDGVLTFVGSSGGGLSEVYWDDVIGRPTLLSSFIDDVVDGHYLPLSGGQMTGSISYPLEYMGNIRDLASSCIFDYTDSLTAKGAIDNKRSLMGYAHNVTYDSWSNIISVRGDSDKYGMYIYSSMTEYGGSLYWNRQEGFEGAWQGVRVILDSVNWSQFVTAGDGGNYLPLKGGTINGSLRVVSNAEIGDIHTFKFLNYEPAPYGLVGCIYSSGAVSMQIQREANNTEIFNMLLQPNGGNVGINDLNPVYPLQVGGSAYIKGTVFSKMITFDGSNAGANSYAHARLGTFDRIGGMALQFGNSNGDWFTRFSIIDQQWTIELFSVDKNGNVLSAGGITMYSDIRKKTKLQDVELTLQQIAEAPLIEHYYNNDEKKTTHVGSIAQYWASMNDWFCKLDSEGYYTMEVQNAALASAISIARELVKYESKTDRKIRLLKDRVKELEDKIKKLENN